LLEVEFVFVPEFIMKLSWYPGLQAAHTLELMHEAQFAMVHFKHDDPSALTDS
jgi:hypothetical protein